MNIQRTKFSNLPDRSFLARDVEENPAKSPQTLADIKDTPDRYGIETVELAGHSGPKTDSDKLTKLATGVAAVSSAYMLGKAAMHIAGSANPLLAGAGVLAASAGAYLAADLGSGFFHHAVDNYAKPEHKVFGKMATEFMVHHYFANSMEQHEVSYYVDPTMKVMAPALAAAAVGVGTGFVSPAAGAAVTTAIAGGLFAQLSHAWTHSPNPPKIAKVLQKVGIAQDNADHRHHHKAPWSGNYCIVNGALNPLLDKTNFWRKWERGVHAVTGAEPKTWQHPAVKDFALGKISEAEFDKRFADEISQFKENIDFKKERAFAADHIGLQFEENWNAESDKRS